MHQPGEELGIVVLENLDHAEVRHAILWKAIDLFGGESEGHLVPIEAVFAAEDEALESETRYVWKVDSETMRASRQGVRVGSLTGNNIVVLEGIESGDMIVSAGVNSVLENMLLRKMSREAGL